MDVTTPPPVVDYLRLGPDGPRLVTQECAGCGALAWRRPAVCGRCGGNAFASRDAAPTGRLQSFTIVYRAPFPVEEPYVSAVVALDDGGVVKANLVGVAPRPDAIVPGMRLRITTVDRRTADGTQCVAFAFEPAPLAETNDLGGRRG